MRRTRYGAEYTADLTVACDMQQCPFIAEVSLSATVYVEDDTRETPGSVEVTIDWPNAGVNWILDRSQPDGDPQATSLPASAAILDRLRSHDDRLREMIQDAIPWPDNDFVADLEFSDEIKNVPTT